MGRRARSLVAVTLMAAVSMSVVTAAALAGSGSSLVSVKHKAVLSTTVKAHSSVSFKVLGTAAVPSTGVSAVLLSIGLKAPRAAGGLVVYPYGTHRPGVLSASFAPGRALSTQVVVSPRKGRATLYNSSDAPEKLVVTMADYYAAPGTLKAAHATTAFVPVTPRRLASVAVRSTGFFVAAGKLGVPKTDVAGVVLSVTVENPQVAGALRMYPYGTKPPKSTTLAFRAGRSTTTLVVVKPGTHGRVAVKTTTTVRVWADVVGYLRTLRVPGAPRQVTAVAGAGSAVVSWRPPVSNGGAPISAYRVVSSPAGAVVTSATTTATVRGLTNGTTYVFSVVAVNSRGAGPRAASAGTTPVAVPAAPTGVVATATGLGAVTVRWTTGVSNGSAISGFTLRAQPGGATATATASPAVMSGLVAGQAYTFTVTATNGVGASPTSAPSNLAIGEGTSLAYVSTAGVLGAGDADSATLSGDGRFVVFDSSAANLVTLPTNAQQNIFVRDRFTDTTSLISVNAAGTAGGDHASVGGAISADGRYVAFESVADDLVTGDTNAVGDVFVRDLQLGTTTLVSKVGALQGDATSWEANISTDGSTVVFESAADNLVPGDTNTQEDAFSVNLSTHVITRVSVSTAGAQGDAAADMLAVSGDGRYTAWRSSATTLVTNVASNSQEQVFLHDATTGITTMVSANQGPMAGDQTSEAPTFSADGHYLLFTSDATNIVSGDNNMHSDAFVDDTRTGLLTRVSVGAGNVQADGNSFGASLSADGRYVTFGSDATNLVGDDTNGFTDVFRAQWQAGTVQRISQSSAGAQGNRQSVSGIMTPDGQHIAFISRASNLTAGVPNTTQFNVLVSDLG
jgi:Tol biopolymer transport system component